jgi:phage terminase large subunit
VRIRLPNAWSPRHYQRGAWAYLENGGKRAVVVAHRRWGKDDIALHRTAVAVHERVGTYWHMLPEAAQARKAIWNAINPHTGKRRIDEAFPEALRKRTLNNEMFIEFRNGSTWQVVGSDNFNALVGTPPIGLVFSEYALANPAAWSYLRPILLENDGWALFIYTPRGKNHGHALLKSAKESPGWYWEVSKVSQTQAVAADLLDAERREMIRENGEDVGEALFAQEWECSFDAAILGAFYGVAIMRLEERKGVRLVPFQPHLPCYTAWDIGRTDDTSIWWYQMVRGEVHVVDFYSAAGEDPDSIAKVVIDRPAKVLGPDGQLLRDKRYHYGMHYLPHDARAKTFASGGKSAIEQLGVHLGLDKLRIVPSLSVQDGIQAVRKLLPTVYFDEENCSEGVEALKQYQREYDEERKAFRQTPLHNWASNPADAFRMLAIAAGNEPKITTPDPGRPLIVGPGNQSTLNDMWAAARRAQVERI